MGLIFTDTKVTLFYSGSVKGFFTVAINYIYTYFKAPLHYQSDVKQP